MFNKKPRKFFHVSSDFYTVEERKKVSKWKQWFTRSNDSRPAYRVDGALFAL